MHKGKQITRQMRICLRMTPTYLQPLHLNKCLRSTGRWSHCPHTPHTHPPTSQNALLHHSQTANQGNKPDGEIKLVKYLCSIQFKSQSGQNNTSVNVRLRYVCGVTWHFPPRQAEMEPRGTVLPASHRVPSMN